MALDVFWHCYIMDLMKKLRLYDVPRKSRSNLYLTRYLSGGLLLCFVFFLRAFPPFSVSPGSISEVLINVSKEALFPKESSFEFNNG